MLKEKIKMDILAILNDAEVQIFSKDNKYFNAVVVSDMFKDKDLVARQTLIYNIIGKYIINKDIHAISFKTYTIDEWKDENND